MHPFIGCLLTLIMPILTRVNALKTLIKYPSPRVPEMLLVNVLRLSTMIVKSVVFGLLVFKSLFRICITALVTVASVLFSQSLAAFEP